VTEMVGGELQFPSLSGSFEAARDQSGVVDEQVKRAVPRLDESSDGAPVGEVEVKDARSDRFGRLLDRFSDVATRRRVTNG